MPEGTGLRAAAAAVLLAFATPGLAVAVVPDGDMAAKAYVRARLASAFDASGTALREYQQALRYDEDPEALARALDAAIHAGDFKTALALADRIDAADRKTDAASPSGRATAFFTHVASYAARRDWKAYQKSAAAFSAHLGFGTPVEALPVLIEAWGKAATGDIDGALAAIDPAKARGIAASYFREARANILAYGKRWPDAAAAYAAIVAGTQQGNARIRLAAAGAMLEANPGDKVARERALLVLGQGGSLDPVMTDARARFAANPGISGKKIGDFVETPARGLALLYVRLAADLNGEGALPAAVRFARLATLADPSLPDGWTLLANVLAREGATGEALQALGRAPQSGPWGLVTLLLRSGILEQAGETEQARALLLARTVSPDASADDWLRLAELERRSGAATDAISSYAKVLPLIPEGEEWLRARVHFLRGSVLEQQGDWAEAEPELRRAVQLQDENPVYLNYLGYSLLVHGGDVGEGRDLLTRAFALAPENGAIMDSIGWAEHLLGNDSRAVQLLERAFSAEPADATIADHLGDALWKAGRRIEAMNIWRTAAGLQPDEELAGQLQHKLIYGLDVAMAQR